MDTSSGADHPAPVTPWDLLGENGIDRDWLTAELNRAGFSGRLEQLEPELVGTGQVGENVRCRLIWDDQPADGTAAEEAGDDEADEDGVRPRSVVIKLASSNAASRAAAEATRTYIREVGFYRDVADSVAIRVPAVYHLSEAQAENRFILVMEDIAPAAAGDQLRGCTLEQAELAVAAAADLHGSTWGRPGLAELAWIDQPTPERAAERVDLFRMLYPGFVERYQDRLSAEQLAFGQMLADRFDRWTASNGSDRCLVHGDFRLDNMLFGTAEPAPPLTTVDWQTPSLGGGLSDIAYFLSGSLERQTLRRHESELLDRYRGRMAEHGVELSVDQAWTGYRLAAPAGFVMAVIASQLVGQTDRGDEMFMVMATGSIAQSIDLETAALID